MEHRFMATKKQVTQRRDAGSARTPAKRAAAKRRGNFHSLGALGMWLAESPQDIANPYFRPALTTLRDQISALLGDAPAQVQASGPSAALQYGATRVVVDFSGHDGMRLKAAATAVQLAVHAVQVLQRESKPVDGPVFARMMQDELRWHLRQGVASIHETKF
jgi:hypothetical protein